jgi:hypothetical protein
LNELELFCGSTYAPTMEDGSSGRIMRGGFWASMPVGICMHSAGHAGPHRQFRGYEVLEWTNAQAVRDRCTSLCSKTHPAGPGQEEVHLRCAREAGHRDLHSMNWVGASGSMYQVTWEDPPSER